MIYCDYADVIGKELRMKPESGLGTGIFRTSANTMVKHLQRNKYLDS
jgi:hypothetical protein